MPKNKSISKLRHAKYLRSLGVPARLQRPNSVWPEDTYVPRDCAPLSNAIPSNGYKSELTDYKWRQGCIEKPAEIQEALNKSKRVAPAYNKGGYMYITEDADLKSLGKKV